MLGLENGLRAAYDKNTDTLIGASARPALRNRLPAEAARYVIDRFPDATRHFKVERPEQLADLAAVLLPRIEAERPAAVPRQRSRDRLRG